MAAAPTKGAGFGDERTMQDLAVIHRPLEVQAGATVMAAVAGAVLGPLAWAVVGLAGTRLPAIVPVWLALLGLMLGAVTPRLVLRAEAAKARQDFRHALGAYLDVLVLLLAANEGPEGAMETAARAGNGSAFMELRRATVAGPVVGRPDLGRPRRARSPDQRRRRSARSPRPEVWPANAAPPSARAWSPRPGRCARRRSQPRSPMPAAGPRRCSPRSC